MGGGDGGIAARSLIWTPDGSSWIATDTSHAIVSNSSVTVSSRWSLMEPGDYQQSPTLQKQCRIDRDKEEGEAQ
jgi:hypothetical protein